MFTFLECDIATVLVDTYMDMLHQFQGETLKYVVGCMHDGLPLLVYCQSKAGQRFTLRWQLVEQIDQTGASQYTQAKYEHSEWRGKIAIKNNQPPAFVFASEPDNVQEFPLSPLKGKQTRKMSRDL
jgi:hypothetical protein